MPGADKAEDTMYEPHIEGPVIVGCSRCKREVAVGWRITQLRDGGLYHQLVCADCFPGPFNEQTPQKLA